MRRAASLSAMLALLLLAGCAVAPRAPDETAEVAAILAHHERMTGLRIEEQRREFNAAQAAFEQGPNDTTRLQLALTMLLPRAPWRDDARIHQLLGAIEVAPNKLPSPRHDLAQLLLRQVAERQRAQRDEQRKADLLSQQLREERNKNEEMQNKIESLRAIDRESRMRKKTP